MSQTTLTPASAPRPIGRQVAITVLAVASGLVHLYRALMMFGLLGAMGMRGGGPRGGRFAGGPPPGMHPGGGGPGIMGLIPVPLSVLFLLNFIGYIVLAVAFSLPALQRYHQVIRWVLLVFALVTIILWYLFTGAGPNQFPLGYGDKVIEVALIVLLLFDMRSPAPNKG